MARLLKIKSIEDSRGTLSVLEGELSVPFAIQRVYYIYGVKTLSRGGHRHKKTRQFLICLSGSCVVEVDSGNGPARYSLETPSTGLLVEPEDWHVMRDFSKGAVLLVLASEHFADEDYIDEPYGSDGTVE